MAATIISWPSSQDYNEAIQSPATNFADDDLRRGQAVTNALGIPLPCSGNFADVYQVRSPDGSRWAVKCFTREVPGLRERYQEIGTASARRQAALHRRFHLPGARHSRCRELVSGSQDGMGRGPYPQSVRRPRCRQAGHVGGAVANLGAHGAAPARPVSAHADLQHGNVLLVPDAGGKSLALKLIDYDGMFVPALAGNPSGEVGHAAYQHPQRFREGTYSPAVDRFPLLVVATALSALKAGGRALWEKYDNGDNLLFRQQDLEVPAKSMLFYDLLKLDDPPTRSLTENLIEATRKPLEETPLLEGLIPDGRPSPVPPKSEPATPAPVRVPEPIIASHPAPVERSQDASPRRRRRGNKAPLWIALGSAAAVVVVVVVVVRSGSGPKTPDSPPVAAKGPGGDDRPKDADKAKDTDPARKKDKTDTPEKPAPLPRLVAFPKLSLPERGAADLQVKVERQGYAGPIKVQVDNLPPGVTCQRLATIPAGESALRLEFRTDGTAAEGTATVEVIATADARTADRQTLSLVVPKSAASAKLPEPLPTTWKSLAPMPTARILLAAVTGPDAHIYAIGGENANGRLHTVEVYDPSTNKWTTVASMPTAPITWQPQWVRINSSTSSVALAARTSWKPTTQLPTSGPRSPPCLPPVMGWQPQQAPTVASTPSVEMDQAAPLIPWKPTIRPPIPGQRLPTCPPPASTSQPQRGRMVASMLSAGSKNPAASASILWKPTIPKRTVGLPSQA